MTALLRALRALAVALSFFPFGQCTWWAAHLRPDLQGAVWGNAGAWADEARRVGIPTGSAPAPGAIAVWAPWQAGAYGLGHVAYVERVGRGGWFLVSEMDWPWPGAVSRRWVPPWAGVRFIYQRAPL